MYFPQLPVCQSKLSHSGQCEVELRLRHRNAAFCMKMKQTPLHVSPDILVASLSLKNLYDTFLTKCPEMSKVCLHVENDL